MNQIRERLSVFYKYTFLLRELVVRDIKVKYKRSFLGLFWTILNPLLMMVVMTIVFSNMFRNSIPNFPIYYMTGNLFFSFNSESTNQAMNCIPGNASLIKKVYIPKYLFPLSKVMSSFVNLFFSFIAMLVVMLALRMPFHSTMWLIPLPIFYLVLFTTGLSILLSCVAVFFRDMIHLYSVITLAWMYLTPLFYPFSALSPAVQSIIKINPMYQFINFFRKLVLYGEIPSLLSNIYCLLPGVVMIALGLFFFYKNQNKFILYM